MKTKNKKFNKTAVAAVLVILAITVQSLSNTAFAQTVTSSINAPGGNVCVTQLNLSDGTVAYKPVNEGGPCPSVQLIGRADGTGYDLAPATGYCINGYCYVPPAPYY